MINTDPKLVSQDEMPLEYNQSDQKLEGAGFSAKILVDNFNSRIKVQRHVGGNMIGLIKATLELARTNGLTKISFLSREDEWEIFLSRGFVLEGIIKGYYQGDDGYIMARFIDPKRRYSERLEEENQAIEQIVETPRGVEVPRLPAELVLKDASRADVPVLARMYKRVFSSYPTPIFDEDFLAEEISGNMLYKVIWHGDEPVSAAAADLDERNKAAELTDCGTVPEFRGQGLITLLIHELEGELRRQDYRSFFGMARAVSFGMNLVFRRFGYEYRGRLINHGIVAGRYEDLNLWVKQLHDRSVCPPFSNVRSEGSCESHLNPGQRENF